MEQKVTIIKENLSEDAQARELRHILWTIQKLALTPVGQEVRPALYVRAFKEFRLLILIDNAPDIWKGVTCFRLELGSAVWVSD